jgi:pyruvate dehydrogenase E2 component (dihydrolipoamide acetyltransferase)
MEHPWVNSWWVDGEAVEKTEINIALAIATDRGLYNPVIKNCGELSLRELSRKATDLGRLAHSGKLTPNDLDGGTFTVSNMGMLGVDSFRAIITPPQAAVLAVGTVKGEVIVDESGEPAVAPVMRMTLAADHRILDGADAAEFMATLKSYLEAPVTLISH